MSKPSLRTPQLGYGQGICAAKAPKRHTQSGWLMQAAGNAVQAAPAPLAAPSGAALADPSRAAPADPSDAALADPSGGPQTDSTGVEASP